LGPLEPSHPIWAWSTHTNFHIRYIVQMCETMSRAHTHGMSNILAVMLTRPQPPKPRPKPSTVYLAKHLEISSNIDMFHQGWGLSPGYVHRVGVPVRGL